MRLILFILALILIMPCVFAKNAENNADFVKINSGEEQTDSKYTFDDNTLSGKVVKLEKGTELPISLVNPVDTSTIQENDIIDAYLNDKLEIDGTTVAEQGSIVKGKVVKARNGSSGIRNCKVSIIFDKIITTENRIIDISTKKIDFAVSESSRWISLAKSFGLVILTAALTVCSGGAGAEAFVLGVFYLGTNVCNTFKQGGTDVIIPALTTVDIAVDSSVNVIGNY